MWQSTTKRNRLQPRHGATTRRTAGRSGPGRRAAPVSSPRSWWKRSRRLIEDGKDRQTVDRTEKVVLINRTAKVVKGGRRFSLAR